MNIYYKTVSFNMIDFAGHFHLTVFSGTGLSCSTSSPYLLQIKVIGCSLCIETREVTRISQYSAEA